MDLWLRSRGHRFFLVIFCSKFNIFSLLILFLGIFYLFLSGFGTTAGAHRLFAHKTYKAKTPLKILLIFFQSIAFQNSVYDWSRGHRVHHKYCDTNADPHNSRRGFFFSHMGNMKK